MAQRFDQVRREIAHLGATGAILRAPHHLRWACGFTGSNGLLFVDAGRSLFMTDGRYTEQAGQEVTSSEIRTTSGSLIKLLYQSGYLAENSSVLLPSDGFSLSEFEELREHFPMVGWKMESGLLNIQMAQKDPTELEAICRAQSITDAVFVYLLEFIKPGMTEKRLAAEIVYQHLLLGAEEMSFDPIVASGPNGALPHARPTERKIRYGDVVILDFGCFVDGYASDMTRTIVLGPAPQKVIDVHSEILECIRVSCEILHADIPAAEVDHTARTRLKKMGLDEYFVHGLGHGVGLRIHEFPRISSQSSDLIPDNAVVTIEPGVYLPGEFGVRVEDMVHVNRSSGQVITCSPRDLVSL